VAKQRNVVVSRGNRPGEGATISVVRHQTPGVSGVTNISLTVDLGSAPVPERRYVADVGTVVLAHEGARLVFGQSKVTGRDLRSLIVIHMSAYGVHQFLRSTPDMLKTAKEFMQRNQLTVGDLAEINEEPNQTVALAANLVAASYSGTEACMDFYHTSPFVVMQVKAGGDFAADPVVRVSLPMVLLYAICEKLEKIKTQLPSPESWQEQET
jgi:hypothetical protein